MLGKRQQLFNKRLQKENIVERRQALEEIRFILKRCEDALQGDRTPEDMARMRLIDECVEIEHINQCVDSLQFTQNWLTKQIHKELKQENELLPSEGSRTGFLAGE